MDYVVTGEVSCGWQSVLEYIKWRMDAAMEEYI